MSVYIAPRYQRGHGIGSIMRGILRVASPTLKKHGKSALKAVGRQFLKSGSDFFSDISKEVLYGKNGYKQDI